MNLAGAGIDELWQRIDICGQQLLEPAYVENQSHDGLRAGILFKDFLGGAPCPALGLLGRWIDVETSEQHFAYLSRRPDIEARAGHLISLGLEFGQPRRQPARHGVKLSHVDTHAFPLHTGEYGDKRPLNLGIQFQQFFFFESPDKQRPQCKSKRGALAGGNCSLTDGQYTRLLALSGGKLIIHSLVGKKSECHSG